LDDFVSKSSSLRFGNHYSPSSPHGVHVHALGNIDNELDVGIVIVVGAAGYLHITLGTPSTAPSASCTHLNILVRHANVLGIGLEILGRRHDGELDGALISKRLVCPLPHRADLFDCCDTIVCNEHLRRKPASALLSSRIPNNANSVSGPAYLCNYRVAVVGGYKVLHLAWLRSLEMVAANEV
jgi:hypothetical protein